MAKICKFLALLLLVPSMVLAAELRETAVDIRNPVFMSIAQSMYAPEATVIEIWMYQGFSDGGSNDLPEDGITAAQARLAASNADQRWLIVPSSSPLRYDRIYGGHNWKISSKDNTALRLARAQWFNSRIGNRANVYAPGLTDDRKAIYLVGVHVPDKQTVVREIVHEVRPSAVIPDWFRAGVGWGYVSCWDINSGLPMANVSAGWNLGRVTSLGAYAGGGMNFGSPSDRTFHAGVELTVMKLVFYRLGYRTGAVEIPGDGHTLARFEGPELGGGIRYKNIEFGFYGSPGKYADVNDRQWRNETMGVFELTIGNRPRREGF